LLQEQDEKQEEEGKLEASVLAFSRSQEVCSANLLLHIFFEVLVHFIIIVSF